MRILTFTEQKKITGAGNWRDILGSSISGAITTGTIGLVSGGLAGGAAGLISGGIIGGVKGAFK